MGPGLSRRGFVTAAGAGMLALSGGARAGEIGKPEKAKLMIGLAVPAASFLPVYVMKVRTAREQGLDIEFISFRGDSEVSQALGLSEATVRVHLFRAVRKLRTLLAREKA